MTFLFIITKLPDQEESMIEVQHLTKRYGSHKAVDDLTFKAEPGQIYGFLGPNGAGKSTTMNIMTGYLAATEGTVLINGMDIQKEPEEVKKSIGYLPEVPPVYSDMTVMEYLRFAAELKRIPPQDRVDQIASVLDAADILDVQDRLIRNLSKGYRQRVGLAQALLGNPEILILDEPTAGLDPEQQKDMFDYIRSLKEDHTIILSSHILSDVSAVADYVWIINNGKLVASDTPANLQARMTTSQQVVLRVMGDRKALEKSLRAIAQVKEVTVKEDGNLLLFTITSEAKEDIRPSVSRAAVYAGGAVLGMNLEEKSLEDVFLTLTGENAGAPVMMPNAAEYDAAETVSETQAELLQDLQAQDISEVQGEKQPEPSQDTSAESRTSADVSTEVSADDGKGGEQA